MYVCRLDRPWEETDFLIQGGVIESQQDIDRLARWCRHVYVDLRRSLPEKPPEQTTQTISSLAEPARKKQLIGQTPRDYPLSTTFKDEYRMARGAHARLHRQVRSIFSELRQRKKLPIEDLQLVIDPMVDSIIRNPDAFTWLSRLRSKDGYSYDHSVNAAIWAVAFARQLGLPREQMTHLGMGALLMDVGKLRLPRQLLDKHEAYGDRDRQQMQQHVLHSVEIVSGIDGMAPEVVQGICCHHERHDGSGYRDGLEGQHIPLFGRMLGLVDCYEAITSDRPYARAMSPHHVVNLLYQWRDRDFQGALVEQFIQVLGVYPVGTLVELSDGRIGVVIAQHRSRRLRPRLMLLMDARRRLYANFDILDLKDVTQDLEGKPLSIRRSLDPGAVDIDPEMLFL